MGLKKSKGNMYPWVTHTHCHLGGQCPHRCVYCYVDNPRFGRPARYQGELRLIEEEFKVAYGVGNTIFMENCNDLFAKEVPQTFINRVVAHALTYPDNTYVWQTKNPYRYLTMDEVFPSNSLFGCTIETNRNTVKISTAPPPADRADAIGALWERQTFITVEPILDFDVGILSRWITSIAPAFVNIGADSKGHSLPEPPYEKVLELIERLTAAGIEIREKHNLDRLKGR